MSISTLIVSQALVQHQDGVSLHPDVYLWEKQLAGYSQTWFECDDKVPLSWYASLVDVCPAILLAEKCQSFAQDSKQFWVVSPYHAQLARDTVRVFPEGLFPWSCEDAESLCQILNPLLHEDGMTLFNVGASLLLSSNEKLEAYPVGFGKLSGQLLPDQHHDGDDGGRLNRLLSEIQMLLFQQPLVERFDRGDPDVSGVWFWAPAELSTNTELNTPRQLVPVATRNPALLSIVEPREARVMISEAERLQALLRDGADLPKRIVLSGEGHAVLLKKSIFPRIGKLKWLPKSMKSETILMQLLRDKL